MHSLDGATTDKNNLGAFSTAHSLYGATKYKTHLEAPQEAGGFLALAQRDGLCGRA